MKCRFKKYESHTRPTPGAGCSHYEAAHFQPLRGACLEDETGLGTTHHGTADCGIGFALGEHEEQGAAARASEHGHL